ncbi:secreted protein, partial [gut metagenome]
MTPMLKALSAAVLCAAVSLPAAAAVQGSAGLGVTYSDVGYRDTDADVLPFP